MAKSSIHLQTAKGGTILHNARENYSKSVVFLDEKNELWNDSKTAFKLFREELEIRTKAYTERTGQKLHKNTSTLISGVVNLEQHHTLEDLIPIKKYLEDKFDTKVIQMSVHRDEGKLISIADEDEKLVSGIDFFLNPTNKKLYYEKEFINEIDMSKWKMEKNYHGHFEMLGLDTQGKTLRHKMNIYALKQLQDFTAETLKMERTPSNVIVNEKGEVKRKSRFIKKRLDTHEFKASKKEENEVKKIIKNEKNKIVKKANEIIEEAKQKIEKKNETIRTQNETIKKQNEDKKKLKEELELLKKENSKFREDLKANEDLSTRENFKKQEVLNKQLQEDLKANKIELSEALEKIEELKKEIFHPTIKKIDDTPATNLEVADYFENELNKKDLEIVDLKTENESLKKENSFLKGVVEKVLNYANYKIKELINFGKPQFKKSVSIEDFIEKNDNEDNHKSTLNSLESLNKTLEDFVKPNQKKEDLDYSEYHLQR